MSVRLFNTPATQFGIVISINNGHIRRYFVPDHNGELDNYPVQTGEKLIKAPMPRVRDHVGFRAVANAMVTVALGREPGNPRCAVIDSNGNVVNTIMADPDIDSVECHTLVLHDRASIGWKWTKDGGFFEPAAPETDAGATT